jgi:hypothetical protein
MVRRLLALAFGLSFTTATAQAYDALTVDLTGPSDIPGRVAALVNQSWGVSNGIIPVNLPVVTTNITSNWPALTVAHVDQYVYTPTTNANPNTINTAWLYWPSAPNGRVVLISMGHQGYCLPASYLASYGTQNLVQTLLNSGFAAFVTPMPGCNPSGDVGAEMAVHTSLWSSFGDSAMQYFLDPMIQAINYWQQHGTFKEYSCVGLSGGGWTCRFVPTVEPRITTTIFVAGGDPSVETWGCPNEKNEGADGDNNIDWYSKITQLDMDVIGGYYGTSHTRRAIQVYNAGTPPYTTYPGDDCCMGPLQWTACDQTQAGDRTYLEWTAYFPLIVTAVAPTFVGMNYMMVRDPTATSHQISAWNVSNVIMPALNREVSGARRRF